MKNVNYLENIILQKRQEVEQLIHETRLNPKHSLNHILNQNYEGKSHFSRALSQHHLSVIGEIKRQSPTAGKIGRIDDPVQLALTYCQGGASAISILTDGKNFGGSLTDLREVVKVVATHFPKVAILRKDFIIHPLQLAETVLAGADAALLIAHVLKSDLKLMISEADRLGLEVLTEVHDFTDLELALEANAKIIGINHRNLRTFEIDLNISKALMPLIPPHIVTVAESGISLPEQARGMRDIGFDAILVGEALVRSKDASKLIKLMKQENDES